MKNPYEFEFDDYISFHKEVIRQAEIAENKHKKSITESSDNIHFKTKDDVLKYYDATLLEDYLKEVTEKYGM